MTQINEKDFPSLGEAYTFVQPAYELLVDRFESANARLGAMLSMTSAVAVGAPVLAATALGTGIRTWPFLLSLVFWGLSLLVGVVGLTTGKVKIINPGQLRIQFVSLEPGRFQSELLHHAAEDFSINQKAIDVKHRFGVAAAILFSVASVIFGFGIAR